MKKIKLLLLFVFAGFISYSQVQGNRTVTSELQISNTIPESETNDQIQLKSGLISATPNVPRIIKPRLWQEVDFVRAAPEWLHWDDGVNNTAIGTGSASELAVAARFTPEDLVGYHLTSVSRIKFFPNEPAASYTLKIWQGYSPPTEIYSQEVVSFVAGEWNDIELDSPVDIDTNQELWVGYHFITPTGYPAGCDAGPQVAGKGNMIFLEDSWAEMTDLNPNLTYNWNIQVYVELLADPAAPYFPQNLNLVAGAEGVLNATVSWDNPNQTFEGEELTDLNKVYLYRGEELIHTINDPIIGGTETFFDSNIPAIGLYSYTVFGSNASGDGRAVSKVVFIGLDKPVAPGSISLTPQGNGAHISWDAPTLGVNGGYINPEDITYKVARMPGNNVVAENLNALEYNDNNVPAIGNYYYIVTAYNAQGEGGSGASNPALLNAGDLLMYEMFNYQTGTLPVGWTVQGLGQLNWEVIHFSNAGGVQPELRLNPMPNFFGFTRLVTNPINVEGQSALRFKYKQCIKKHTYSGDNNEIAAFDISYDGGETWSALWEFQMVEEIMADDFVQYFYVPEEATKLQIGIRFEGATSRLHYWYLDNMILEPVMEQDLAAQTITGNDSPSAEMESIYSVTVQNAGTEAASGYTVKLMKEGDIELNAVSGSTLEFGETRTFELTWIPEAEDEGKTYVYGLVEYNEDMVLDNNRTPNLNIDVQPAGTVAAIIGSGNLDLYMPLNFLNEKSLSQTIYYAEEIGWPSGGAAITEIEYTFNFNEPLSNKYMQIWMGETELENLSGGWVDQASLQLVYDGTFDFPGGTGTILIPLEYQYIYGGGNLVIYTHRDDNTRSSGKYFKGSTKLDSKRSRRVHQNTDPLDPTNPPEGIINDDYPNIVIFMSTEGLGGLAGFVSDGTDALEGVKVSILGTMFTTYTDAIGFYELPHLHVGTYDIQFELFGYETLVIEDVVVVADTGVLQDAVLSAIPQYTISGTIKGNDDQLIEGALVKFEGYDDYEVLTDSSGQFSIEDVFEGTYSFSVDAVGYQTYIDPEVPVNCNTDLGIIIITEKIVTPFALMVNVDNQPNGDALFTWNTAEGSFADSFEDGTLDAWHEFIQGPGIPGEGTAAYWHTVYYHDGSSIPDGSFTAKVDWGYNINTWLITPMIIVEDETSMVFNWRSSYYWGVYPNPFGLLSIMVSTNGGDSWEEIWNWRNIGVWTNFTWYESTVSLADYVGQAVHIAINLTGNDNADTEIDNIRIGANLKAGTIALTEPADIDTNAKALPKGSKNNKIINGFNVFLNGEEVASEIEDTKFLFTDLEETNYSAGVQAIFTTGISEIATVDFQVVFGVPINVQVTTNYGNNAQGAQVVLTNQLEPQYVFTAITNADGMAEFARVRKGIYSLSISLNGFEEYEETDIDIQETVTFEAELIEIITTPFGLLAKEGENAGEIQFSWNNLQDWSESFEGGVIPEGWTLLSTNLYQTWKIVGTLNFPDLVISPVDGDFQAFVAWDYEHQNEWLISPPFVAPVGDLTFWYAGINGVPEGGSFCVNITTDGGITWTELWDASELPEGENVYAEPAVIDISTFAGQEVQLAWQAVDADGNGLWFSWFIDHITVGDVKIDVKDLMVANNGNITESARPLARNSTVYSMVRPEDMRPARNRSFLGYNLFLNDLITPVATEFMETEYLFSGLTSGDYVLGVQSVYSSGASGIITLPFTVTNGASDEVYTVTFNVHMHEIEFTDDDVIYISGSMLNWVTPGDDPQNQTMEPTGDPNVFSRSFELREGSYSYKYYLNSGWDHSEWPDSPDRQIVVEKDMVIDNVFGNIDDPVNVSVIEPGELKIYPNPARYILNIVSNETIREIRIIDLIGQMIYISDVQTENYQLNIGQLPNGIYFVQVLTSKGLATQMIQVFK